MINPHKRTVAQNATNNNSSESSSKALELLKLFGLVILELMKIFALIFTLIFTCSIYVLASVINPSHPFMFFACLFLVVISVALKSEKKANNENDKESENENNMPKDNTEELDNNKLKQIKFNLSKELQEIDVSKANSLEVLSNELPPVAVGTPAAESRHLLFTALREELQSPQPTSETVSSRTRSRLKNSSC